MRKGLLERTQVPANSDLSRIQDRITKAIETLASDDDLVRSPMVSLLVTAAIPAGATMVAFRGGPGQTLTLPPANAQGPNTGAMLWIANTSTVPVTIAASGVGTVDGARSVSLPAGSVASFTADGDTKWLSGGITMIGNKTNNAAAPAADNVGALTALANAAAPAWTEGRLVLLSADLAGNLRVREPESSLMVTATAAVNTGATCTLPAAGAGLFHYITKIELVKLYSVVGIAAGAGVVITSTNLPGNPAWTTEQLASAAGTAARVIDAEFARPLKSSVANTATTLVAGAQLQTIWRWNVTYYTGP